MIHGHKKSQKKQKSEDQIQQEKQLTDKINNKLIQFFTIRKQPIANNKIPTLLQFTTILMQLCPDITTIFNYRRQLIQKILQTQQPADKAKTIGSDIKIITKIMQGDPKSYTLWSYRQWLVLKLYNLDQSIVVKEKQLCSMLLLKDQKNFHVWNYRNWVNNIHMNVDTELEFTKAKINSNPFNFSPYHFRSKYLQWKYNSQFGNFDIQKKKQIIIYGMPKDVFNTQLETVRTATFLNPKQEAPWLYYSWLLKQLLPSLLLSIQNNGEDKLKYTLQLSLKVQNFKNVIYIEGNPQFQLLSSQSPSNKWQLIFKQPIEKDKIKAKEDINIWRVKNQSGGRRLAWLGSDRYIQIAEIYQAEENFVKEVIQSQQNQCRFGWLQLHQLYLSGLYLGVSSSQWVQTSKKALQIFSSLETETKGQKYIEKQKEFWERMATQSNLSSRERKLRCR